MTPPARRSSDHPLVEAAQRAAGAAAERAQQLAEQRARLQDGTGTTVADVADAETQLEAALRRRHEARRRLITQQLAHAHEAVLGQEFLAAARRLAGLTLAADVRDKPLEP